MKIITKYFRRPLFGDGYWVRLSDASLRRKIGGRVYLLAREDGEGFIFTRCRDCLRFKYFDDPASGPWLKNDRLDPLRARLRNVFKELAGKSQLFPFRRWDWCPECKEKHGK